MLLGGIFRVIAIDYDEDYVEEIVEDMEMEAEVVEEEYLKKMITP